MLYSTSWCCLIMLLVESHCAACTLAGFHWFIRLKYHLLTDASKKRNTVWVKLFGVSVWKHLARGHVWSCFKRCTLIILFSGSLANPVPVCMLKSEATGPGIYMGFRPREQSGIPAVVLVSPDVCISLCSFCEEKCHLCMPISLYTCFRNPK